MKILSRNTSLLLLIVLAYTVHYYAKHMHEEYSGVIPNYLGDLLCIPIVLTFALNVNNILFKTKTLSVFQIISGVIIFSITFEVYNPFNISTGTKDTFDILCYFIGGWFYYLFLNPKQTVSNLKSGMVLE